MSTKKKAVGSQKTEAGSQKLGVKGLEELAAKLEEIREKANLIVETQENLSAAIYEFNVQAIALRNELKKINN